VTVLACTKVRYARLVKGLRDIKECSGAVCPVFKCFVNPMNDAMRLFDGGVSPPEAELVSGY
jgi:hypothetical protein